MTGKETIVWIVGFLVVASVILGIVGAIAWSTQQGRERDIKRYVTCVEDGGIYIKQGASGDPLCIPQP